MDERQWLGCGDPEALLRHLPHELSERKLRLFACACCRRAWRALVDERSRHAVEAAERFVDGRADASELAAAWRDARAAAMQTRLLVSWAAADAGRPLSAWATALHASRRARWAIEGDSHRWWAPWRGRLARRREEKCQSDLVRDLFGTSRRLRIDPAWLAWRGGAIPNVARAVYEERALPSGHLDAARLAVLADMLEESGCSDAVLLSHLRGPGPHVRGCFAVDAVLGKS
jgi:hypothetical protein